MTHPTKAIYKWLIQDSVRVGNISSSSEMRTQLYNEQDHLSTFPQIEAIDYYTTHTVSSIRITPYPAGHVLGAAMFLIEIAGLKILFTGDYSREEDRHLITAEAPKNTKVDVLITESTYGTASHVPRLEKEAAFMKSITSILNRGGRALLPVFALGKAQELLLILDEYWGKHPEYQKIPIYFASALARKCMVVYQTYISSMNANIKRLFRERMAEAEARGDVTKAGPWDFRYVRSLKSLERFDDLGPCVMLASPGMMQNGVSRELLERWAPDSKNGVVITGYSVEGTMAKLIVTEPEFITAVMTRNTATGPRSGKLGNQQEKVELPRRCSVNEFAFAAHVDGQENREFVSEVNPQVVILVHGERNMMTRFKSKLLSLNASRARPMKVFSPANCEELRIPFKQDKIAKVVGKLAQVPPPSLTSLQLRDDEDVKQEHAPESRVITGVLVQNDFQMSLMAPEDLREYAGLTTTTITCRQKLHLSTAGVDLIKWALEGTFGSLKEITPTREQHTNGTNGAKQEGEEDEEVADEEVIRDTTRVFQVMDCITLRIGFRGEVDIEWEGNMVNDGIADAVLAVLFTVESSPAAVRQSSSSHQHSHAKETRNPHAALDPQTKFDRLCMFLEAQFGPNVTPITAPKKQVKLPTPPADGEMQEDTDAQEEDDEVEWQKKEMERLHSLGIPVPGLEINFENLKQRQVAKVWLEDLSVECASGVLRDRVKAVVERAVECIAPIWAGQ